MRKRFCRKMKAIPPSTANSIQTNKQYHLCVKRILTDSCFVQSREEYRKNPQPNDESGLPKPKPRTIRSLSKSSYPLWILPLQDWLSLLRTVRSMKIKWKIARGTQNRYTARKPTNRMHSSRVWNRPQRSTTTSPSWKINNNNSPTICLAVLCAIPPV